MSALILMSSNYSDKSYVKQVLKNYELEDIFCSSENTIVKRYCEKNDITHHDIENYKDHLDKDFIILFLSDNDDILNIKQYIIDNDCEVDIYNHEEDVVYDEIIKSQNTYVNDSNEDNIKYEDEEFDALVDYYGREKNQLTLIGAPVTGDEVNLPYPMPSLNKISFGSLAEKKLKEFMTKNKGPYCVSRKVDGTSLQVIYNYDKDSDKTTITMCTGGDGQKGKNVSFISEHIDLPKLKENCVIRGELTITFENFEKIAPKLRKRGMKATNSRNAVNGIVNRKDADEKLLRKCFFIAFGICSSTDNMTQQFKQLKEWGFETPRPKTVEYKSSKKFMEYLKERFEEESEKRTYRTDGLVIMSDSEFEQNLENSNPIYAFAFKMNTYAVTKVKKIKWKFTRYGYLTPIAIVKPVDILGSTMRKASAVHAKEIKKKKIGPGAIVSVTFCGDIIPKIVSVITPGTPTYPKIPYHWNDNKIEIIADNAEQYDEVKILRMHYFLKTIGVKHFGEKRVKSLFENGVDSISKLVNLKKKHMDGIDGFRDKTKQKIIDQLKKAFKEMTWGKLMAATGFFDEGIGEERMNSVINFYPDWETRDLTPEDLIQIPGIGPVYSEQIAMNFPDFKSWVEENPKCVPKENEEDDEYEKDLKGEVIVFTGFGSGTQGLLERELKLRGAIVKDTLVLSTTILVKKDKNFTSKKVEQAEARGVKTYTLEKFIKKYKSV